VARTAAYGGHLAIVSGTAALRRIWRAKALGPAPIAIVKIKSDKFLSERERALLISKADEFSMLLTQQISLAID
jgi:hypothetical protein